MVTLLVLYSIAHKKLSKRQSVFHLAEKMPQGNMENWVQWELIEAFEENGVNVRLKGKQAYDCDLIIENGVDVGLEIRTAPNGRLSHLEKAFTDHDGSHFYLFTCLNRFDSNAKSLFEERVRHYTTKYMVGDISPTHFLLVAER